MHAIRLGFSHAAFSFALVADFIFRQMRLLHHRGICRRLPSIQLLFAFIEISPISFQDDIFRYRLSFRENLRFSLWFSFFHQGILLFSFRILTSSSCYNAKYFTFRFLLLLILSASASHSFTENLSSLSPQLPALFCFIYGAFSLIAGDAIYL